MYDLEIKPEADKIFAKLAKKNQKQLQIINNKVKKIRETPVGYKFLRAPLSGFNRVHIDNSFVLIFKVDHQRHVIELWYYGHHDVVYQWQPTAEE